MASWRDTASAGAQQDLDGLLDLVLPLAKQAVARDGELVPSGAAVTIDGASQVLAGEPAAGVPDEPQAVLDALYDRARHEVAAIRAVAFAADVRNSGGSAIRIELEHRDGIALVVLLPYNRSRYTRALALGRLCIGGGDRRIWPR